MECSACGASWPIVKGVPAYRSTEYFGEVSREEMQKLVRLAEEGYWLRAVRAQFKDSNPDMYHYTADLNRASWIPLLPIGPDSTVLDVGSGLGALTHALALTYHRVVSIEPIEERVQFTKTRLDQEGLKNVDLVQTTLDRLPFFEKTFDLIVLNGVLEWVGVWRREGTPREAQIETLTALRRLLKPTGIVLIGIENRIGFESFLGRVDHPGTRFTSLMPRSLASLYLKLRKPGFYRTLLDPTQGYRTYTYSPRGYVKLLREAGFDSVELWWPPQGYNLPCEMYRLADRAEIENYFTCDRNYKTRVNGHAFRRTAKHWALVKTGLIYSMVPDVIVRAERPAEGSESRQEHGGSLIEAVQDVLASPPGAHAAVLMSFGFRNKAVVKLVGPDGTTAAIAKMANVRRPGAEAIEQSFRLLERLQPVFEEACPSLRGTVPKPLQFVHVGSWVASVESAAPGRSLQDVAMDPRYFSDHEEVRHHLERVATWLITAQSALNSLGSAEAVQEIPPAWRQPPDQMNAPSGRSSSDTPSWVQHGDFFTENVFWNDQAGRVCVIDWDQCGGGYPPLFDWFCLLTSLYYTHARIRRSPEGYTVDDLSFRHTYFEPSWFSDLVTALTDHICDGLGLDHGRVIEYFRQYLCVRHHQFMHERHVSQKEQWGVRYQAFYDFFMKNRDACIFHPRLGSGVRAARKVQ